MSDRVWPTKEGLGRHAWASSRSEAWVNPPRKSTARLSKAAIPRYDQNSVRVASYVQRVVTRAVGREPMKARIFLMRRCAHADRALLPVCLAGIRGRRLWCPAGNCDLRSAGRHTKHERQYEESDEITKGGQGSAPAVDLGDRLGIGLSPCDVAQEETDSNAPPVSLLFFVLDQGAAT